MRTIICGSGSLTDPAIIVRAVESAPFGKEITTVLTMHAGQAVDPSRAAPWVGEEWAHHHGIPVEQFKVRWDDVSRPGAVVRVGVHGPYDAIALEHCFEVMLDGADAILIIFDGKSKGSRGMIDRAIGRKKLGQNLLIHVHQWLPVKR